MVTLNSSSLDQPPSRHRDRGTDGARLRRRGPGSEKPALGRRHERRRAIALSPDGANAYVTSAGSDAVAIFDRQPSGMPAQKAEKAGASPRPGTKGCEKGRALDGADGLAISSDGKTVYRDRLNPRAVTTSIAARAGA